jgi:hypothetical protein
MTQLQHTIAGYDEKLVVLCDLVHRDIWECSHDLLLRWQICALLELEVANRSAEREISIDSAKVDEAACCTYPCLLALVLRLVVE